MIVNLKDATDNDILSPGPAPLPTEAPSHTSHVPILVSTDSSTHSVDLDARLGHVNNSLGPGVNIFPVEVDMPSTSSALQYAHQHISALKCAVEDKERQIYALKCTLQRAQEQIDVYEKNFLPRHQIPGHPTNPYPPHNIVPEAISNGDFLSAKRPSGWRPGHQPPFH